VSNILTIGDTGFLGSYLVDRFKTQVWGYRFGELNDYAIPPSIDTVFYCARVCRKEPPRRDRETVLLETKGMVKILSTFSKSKIIYCSSKVVDGWGKEWERPVSREKIGDYFEKTLSGSFSNQIVHLPEISGPQLRKFPPREGLSEDQIHYARSKLIGETLVKSCTKDYTIFRIWDITQ